MIFSALWNAGGKAGPNSEQGDESVTPGKGAARNYIGSSIWASRAFVSVESRLPLLS
jgi:hypothetical protein